MEVGEITKAINMTPRTGQEQTVIVKLKSRIKGHKATVSDDYQRLKEMVVQKKQDELIEKWIQNKLSTTYVRISDNWKPSCEFKYKGWIK
jgi:peptidyl-prolyl cis-trans isomerase SurA